MKLKSMNIINNDGQITIKCKWYVPHEVDREICKTNSDRIFSYYSPDQFNCQNLFNPIVCIKGYLTLTWTKYIIYKQYENSKRWSNTN